MVVLGDIVGDWRRFGLNHRHLSVKQGSQLVLQLAIAFRHGQPALDSRSGAARHRVRSKMENYLVTVRVLDESSERKRDIRNMSAKGTLV